MPKPTLTDIAHLLREIIIPFSQIERDMPLPVPSYRNENDAEHSWALSLLAVVLAPQVDKALDVGLVSIFATVHDVVEVYAGDTSLWGSDRELTTKEGREKKAMSEIRTKLAAFPALSDYIEAYESKESPEAKFVYALDKFINLLIRRTDEGRYFKKRRITREAFKERIADHQRKAHSHQAVKDYYDELLESFLDNPKLFYQEAT